MGKKARGGASAGNPGKRSRPEDNSENATAAKKLLANNRFSVLKDGAEPVPETTGPPKKDRMPPFYVKGFPPGLREEINYYITQGLRCTIQLCTEGYKLMVPALKYYNAVQTMLDRAKVEYFSHDIEAVKPLKVVLRGLYDMDTSVLLEELVDNGLKPVQIHKMARHNKAIKYRDQLYLVHLEKNSTSLKDLQGIRVLFNIVVKWDRYQPVSRGVTQCSNCLLFGHGAKNCHMASRCTKCGKKHQADACDRIDEADPICANCGAAHKATSKACPKRAEYIEIRKKASTRNQPGRKKVPEMNDQNFPPVPRRPIPVLPPLPLNQRLAAARAAQAPENSGQQTTAAPQPQDVPTAPGLNWRRDGPSLPQPEINDGSSFTAAELMIIFLKMHDIANTIKNKTDQLQAVATFMLSYGP